MLAARVLGVKPWAGPKTILKWDVKPRSRTTELDVKPRSGTTQLDVKPVTGTAWWKGGTNQVVEEEPHGGFEIGEEMVDAYETEVELNIGEEAEED